MKYFALKLRIYPNQQQIIYFNKAFGCSRFLFNLYLYKRIQRYQDFKETYYLNDFKKYLTFLKKTNEFSFLKEVDKFALEFALEQVDEAYQKFFKKQSGFPNFKSKKNSKQSYTTKFTNGNIKINQNENGFTLQIPKIKELQFAKPKSNQTKNTMDLILTKQANIKGATVSQVHNRYYLSLLLQQDEAELEPIPLNQLDLDQVIGVDLGLKEFATISNGKTIRVISNPKFYRKTEQKIKKHQKRLSKKNPNGKNYNKQKMKLQQAHEKIKNQRMDFLHKWSIQLVHENQVIILEDLSIKNMIKNKKLAKSIADASWSSFIRMCQYKAKWNGKRCIQVNRFYASSKLCHVCHHKNIQLRLTERSWVCSECGAIHERDENAAINIREEGLKELLS